MTENKLSFLSEIVKVIYAPTKAFKEISQNPKYYGPILILILFSGAYTASAYTFLSKAYSEKTVPTLTVGSEWSKNTTLWTSNGIKTESTDGLSGNYYGNKSIEFAVTNSSLIWMQLSGIANVHCTGSDGYKNITVRLKPILTGTVALANASMYLFSSQTDYFYYDLVAHNVSLDYATWNNFTIQAGPGSDWTTNGTSPDWSNIVGLRFEFELPQNADMNMRLGGLFFRGVFSTSLENIPNSLFNFSVFALMQFVIRWVIIGSLLYVMTKGFGSATTWRVLLVLIGFVLITMFVQSLITTAAFSTLSTVYYPFEFAGGTQEETQAALNQVVGQTWLASDIARYAQMAVYVWTIALCAIAARTAAGISWARSALLSAVAFFTSIFVESFVLGI